MPEDAVAAFIGRWREASGTESANAHSFLTELCALLELPRPDPATQETEDNSYVFERKVTFRHQDGSETYGFIDCYRRDCFVLEAKQTGKAVESQSWGSAMRKAHGQAQSYARALPADEGRPPFLLVVDVGRVIELYSEFSRSGATYVPFPDPRSHRLRLEDLEKEEVRQRLRTVWTDPLSLDPTRHSAKVTRAIATDLAKLAEGLEKAGHGADTVAAFLMRCLFTMFAEDVGLLPSRSFTQLLEETRKEPKLFPRLMPGLWKAMNDGTFSSEIRADVLRFNGGIFADQRALPLDRDQIDLLLEASRADWRHVEPAIFGTLLERALDPVERHRLGAHYTPRAYVERLVLPTVIEPLREEWTAAQAAALNLESRGLEEKAMKELLAFHQRLCKVRVLDPACGSGNFLYVTLEHLKRLEGEVFNALEELGDTQSRLEIAGATVDPHQMLGLETNPRAARIAEAVLWIGYLQWHFRTRGDTPPLEPILKDFHNIENRDAVLAWDDVELVRDEHGKPVSRWDGRTTKTHPVTGEQVPDEAATVPLERYVNPRKAKWPAADFVVGNPPFIGHGWIRTSLGDGYAEALRRTYDEVPDSADYVMYWWYAAAKLLQRGKIQRFGLITTNSLRQTFNRRVLESFLQTKKPISVVFAIPDHPWVDSSDGAAVRIAMTVGERGQKPGRLCTVQGQTRSQELGYEVDLRESQGLIHPTLRVGADISSAGPLTANLGLSNTGVKLHGAGFIVTKEEAAELGLGRIAGLQTHIRHYRNGRDLAQVSRGVMVIDLHGLEIEQVKTKFPEVYQRVLNRVKPERDHNKEAYRRENWWLFGRKNTELRASLTDLDRFVATVETCKHRFFVFLEESILPDNMLVSVASADPTVLGALSSRIHIVWALAAGARLGIGNDPRYTKTRCFEPFPFPALDGNQRLKIAALAEQLDAHRKRQQELHPDLTMTGMYNVLEKLRTGEKLTAKEKTIHEQGLVSVLAQIHDDLDAAVLEAYGWEDLAPALVGKPGGTVPSPHKSPEQEEAEEELLQRLVDLNAERAAEEARGIVRWLRPEFQNPKGRAGEQESLLPGQAAAPVVAAAGKNNWPKALAEQVQAVRSALAEQPAPATPEIVARTFKRAQTRRVAELLETLTALGQARATEDGRYAAA